MKDLAICY